MRVGRAALFAGLLASAAFGGCKAKTKPLNQATPPQCLLKPPVKKSPDNLQIESNLSSLRVLWNLLKRHDVMAMSEFVKYKELMRSWSDLELVGLASRDPNEFFINLGILRGIPQLSEAAPVKDQRDYLLAMAFLRASGGALWLYEQGFFDFSAAIGLGKYSRELQLYRRMLALKGQANEIEVFMDYRAFMWVMSPDAYFRSETAPQKRGKWEVAVDSREAAIKMVESLFPCFSNRKLALMKFDLDPFYGKYRLIFYCAEKDPEVKEILERATGQRPFWISGQQTLDGQTLNFMLERIPDSVPELTEANKEKIQKEIQRPEAFARIGLSDFQRQLLLRALTPKEHSNITDPIDYVFLDYLEARRLSWGAVSYLLSPAAKPLIQEAAKVQEYNRRLRNEF